MAKRKVRKVGTTVESLLKLKKFPRASGLVPPELTLTSIREMQKLKRIADKWHEQQWEHHRLSWNLHCKTKRKLFKTRYTPEQQKEIKEAASMHWKQMWECLDRASDLHDIFDASMKNFSDSVQTKLKGYWVDENKKVHYVDKKLEAKYNPKQS